MFVMMFIVRTEVNANFCRSSVHSDIPRRFAQIAPSKVWNGTHVNYEAWETDKEQSVKLAIYAGFGLFLYAVLIFVKAFKILMGIVNDRVQVYYKAGKISDVRISQGPHEHFHKRRLRQGNDKSARFDTRAASVILVRQRLGELQSNTHRERFWMKSPKVFMRLIQFLTFFQALYLALVFLLFRKTSISMHGGGAFVALMVWPVLISFCVMPATMALLVIDLDLVGYIGSSKLQKIEEQEHHSKTGSEAVKFCPLCGCDELARTGDTLDCDKCGTSGIDLTVTTVDDDDE